MGKKVAILTINDNNNYGNRLQNYALQEVIKTLGFFVQTIINDTKYIPKNNENGFLPKIQKLKDMPINEISKKLIYKLERYLHKNEEMQYKAMRLEAFKKFNLLHITETQYIISPNNIPYDLADRFDYFVTGSDQVWNPYFRHGSPIDFLTFAPQNKRIAFAPSFGISKIPPEFEKKYKIWISEMPKLSVREKAGAEIIKELTGRDADILIDPTLMLTKEKWLSISRKADNKPKGEYLLTYFLDEKTKEEKKRIRAIAKKNNLQIVNLADIRDKKTYIAGPSEFIDYINSASVVFTDSFHGAIFSILMGTSLIVFRRKGSLTSMNSRIETLLTTLKLESRLQENINTNEQILIADYSFVASIIERERKKALDYLKEALNVRDEI